MAKLGGLMCRLRKNAGKSMGDVARHLGVSVTYVSDVERDRRSMTPENVTSVAALFGVDPTPLLEAAAHDRKSIELEVRSPAQAEAGAFLTRTWPQLGEDDYAELVQDLKARLERKRTNKE